MSEKLCLKWNNFNENVLNAFGNFKSDKDFTDVTLACDDGEQVEAHKVILAASSPFFQNILKRNKQRHLVICLRGLKSANLLAIMDFLYFGEAKIFEEDLESFLAVGEELKLSGLMGPKTDDALNLIDKESFQNAFTKAGKTINNPPVFKHEEDVTNTPVEQSLAKYEEEMLPSGQIVPLTNDCYGSLQELDEKVVSMIDKTENKNVHGQPIYRCALCGKEGKNGQVKNHIEANHLERVSITCDLCQNMFRTRESLRKHNATVHR